MATSEEDDFKTIRDPEEQDYNQRKRLQEIWEERKQVREWRREISHSIGKTLSQAEAERHYHDELKQYIGVIHTLFLDIYRDNGGGDLWTNESLGVQVVQPPEEVADHCKPEQRPFKGLRSIIETPPEETITFTATETHHHKKDREITAQKTVTVPWHVLDTAWMYTNSFLSKVGFEAKLGRDGRPYDDWREQFESGVYTGPDDLVLPHDDV